MGRVLLGAVPGKKDTVPPPPCAHCHGETEILRWVLGWESTCATGSRGRGRWAVLKDLGRLLREGVNQGEG